MESIMATTKDYISFILDQLSGLEDITCRSMMGEYIIYYRGRIAAYVCDNRLLVKPVGSCLNLRRKKNVKKGTRKSRQENDAGKQISGKIRTEITVRREK